MQRLVITPSPPIIGEDSSLHRSQIFREFLSDAGSGSGILRLGRRIPLLSGEKNLKAACLN